jgi:recombination protein U
MINIAQNIGKRFENNFKASVPEHILYYRLKDSASSFGGANNLRFSSKNPCDCFLYSHPNFYALELKSVGTSSISFERSKEDKGVIHFHQIEGLTEYSKVQGTICGFLLNFRRTNGIEVCYFQNINDFNNMISKLDKKSFNEKDILHNNAIIVNGTKKKVNYTYDIEQFIKDTKLMNQI